MGYTRVVQYADVVELYEYEKAHVNRGGVRQSSKLDRKRRAERKSLSLPKSAFSQRQSKTRFFQICSEALYTRGAPHLVTLTNHENNVSLDEGYRNIYAFKEQIKNKMGVTITYIAVPEWQKKGRLHFHLLVWGLLGQAVSEHTERDTRNLQRLYGKGFLDVRLAYDNSPKLASYLTKYFTKSNNSTYLKGRKAYTTSRGIVKPRTYGSNAFDAYRDIIVPEDTCISEVVQYNTQYLGRCSLTKYKTKKTNENNN